MVEPEQQPDDKLVDVEFTVCMPRVPTALADTIREMGHAASSALDPAALLDGLDKLAALMRRHTAESTAEKPDPLNALRAYAETIGHRNDADRHCLQGVLKSVAGHRFDSADSMKAFARELNHLLRSLGSELEGPDGSPVVLSADDQPSFRFLRPGKGPVGRSRAVTPQVEAASQP